MNRWQELTGDLAPPMANGEIVFDEPWQGRVFGMAKAMADSGSFTWDEFRTHLVFVIKSWEQVNTGEYHYYEHFQAAFERLLVDRDLIDEDALQERTRDYLARPPGHDHGHDHGHHDDKHLHE